MFGKPKRLLTGLLACALCGSAFSDTIWSEDFSSYVDAGITGAGNNGGYPGSVTQWSIDVSNCTLSNAADYFMAVDTRGGRMEAVDIDGEAIWTSESIDISGYTHVSLSVDTSETGSSTSSSKYVSLFYKLNGGAETAFAVNPTNSGNWGSATATQSGLSGSTLQIVARVNNPNSGDKSIFDNVTVSGDPGAPPVNNAPVLAAIGNQTVTVSNALNFAVTANDVDNDLITLSASHLPPGAVFNTVTNAGSVSNTFTWAVAEPDGVYTSRFYVTDGITNDFEEVVITVTNAPAPPPLTGAVWNVIYNLPYQSGSGSDYPGQFEIRDALVERIDALQNGDSVILSTFTFSAEAGAGVIMNAMSDALDRGATISFIADGDINLGTVYGGTNSLLTLSTRSVNPLILAVDGSTSGIMHDKLGLFDYGESNQWVFITSWNFTLGASANQWNIALETRSPELYTIYTNETAEFLAGRFHDDPAKSHAHDGSVFPLDESWGTDFARFSPPPTGDSVEDDIIAQIDSAQSNIVFALNKLNREPIRDALIAAANRGVEIRGVMPRSDTDPGGVSSAVYSALTNYVEFLPAYAEADYSALDDGTNYNDLVHAKYMVIDSGTSNAVVIHGSANWTAEALVNTNDNDENTLFLRHNKIAAQFYNHFERITGTGAYSEGNSTIVSWNFNDADRIADGGIAANQNQTVSRDPSQTNYTFSSGTILSANKWDNGAGTKYWETSFTTIDHTDIKVSSVQLASSTGPSDFKLQYKIGIGGTYADVPYSDVHVPDGGNGILTRVLLPQACENQPAVFLRWLLTSNYRTDGSTAIGSSGAGRIDDIIITGTAYNQPPVLDPIGNRTVFEGEALQFTLTAADPVDGDAISYSATNLPTGAGFTNDTFTWISAAPVGQYPVTFFATDKDGSDSETVTIHVIKKPLMIISEVADPADDGGDAYRFVELYNAGSNAVDLATGGWHLSKQVNGGTWYDIELTGTVPAAGTWVVANNSADFEAAYAFTPDQESGTISGNGDDAYFLFYNGTHDSGTLIDIYGEFDTDGTDTAWDYENSRAERNKDIFEPNPIWTASEWTITPGATTNNMTPGVHGPTPEFQGLENPFVFLGDDLNLTVTAANTIRPDIISLSATNLPDGALFPPATGTNSVSSLLFWASPPAGVYNATLVASGEIGSTTRSITITVSATAQLEGKFSGWKTDTIVKLDNGQFWHNIGGAGSIIDPPVRNPQVTVTKTFGTYRMTVEHDTDYATVEPIDVAVSAPANDPSGLHQGNIYELSDGTVWEQTSWSDNVTFSTDPATVWRWTENGKTYLRFLDLDHVALGTCEVITSQRPTGGPVLTKIDGYFRGWSKNRIFALANGQFWQQTVADSSVDTLYRPDATLTNVLDTGTWRLYVDGASAPGYVEVQQLTNVTRTAIDGMFYGFGNGEFFHLQNGQWWRQTSLDTSSSIRSNPEVLVWNNVIEMPDEGRSVSVEQLTVTAQTAVTNDFSGLRYGNLYQLANGQNQMQISFETISKSSEEPDAILWIDDNQTHLLLRASDDSTLGSCTVVDPDADEDGDQIANAAEYIAGTDPDDANDLFLINDLEYNSEGRAVLSWNSIKGRTYTVEWTFSLNEAFQPLETGIVWPQSSWIDVVNTAEIRGFYRIRVQLTN